MGLGFALLLWLAFIAWWFWRFDEAARMYHWGIVVTLLAVSGFGYLVWALITAL